MRSMHLAQPGQNAALVEKDVPRPKPRAGEVLVRVYAAGVTPTELSWYPTAHTRSGETRKGAVPSHEFSGEIVETGAGATELAAGQEIYGMNDWFSEGALAEYCITQPGWIAPKPLSLNHAEAASVPIGALTAWQGLFERAKLQAGERVLVHGGAGAVGIFAIQLARWRGAHVMATVSARNFDFVRALGANEVVDYQAARFEERVRDVDVVFDAVGGETRERSWGVLKPAGRLVTIAADSETTAEERVKRAFFIVEPRREQLIEIGKMLDAGTIRTVVDTELAWSQASDAYVGKVQRQGRGKMVVQVADIGARAH